MTQSKKILIVDDEPISAKALKLKLSQLGYEAVAVFSGQNALDELDKREYNLLLLDIIMPDISGWDVLEKIRDKDLKIKIVVITNLSQEEDISKAKNLGAHEFIVKTNVSISQVVEIVNPLLT